MTNRCICALCAWLLAALMAGRCAAADLTQPASQPGEKAARLNVLLIVADDLGYCDLGSSGNKTVRTTFLDELASQGVRFNRFYVAPVGAPTRAGLMTGRYAFRTGVYNTRSGGDTLSDEEVTLAEVLKESGYRTGIFGKWHLGRYARYAPQNQGFEEALCLLQGHAERYDNPDQLLLNGEPVEARGHITDLLTDAAIHFIRNHQRTPFFCYVPYNVPHSPFIVGNSGNVPDGDERIKRYLDANVPLREARIYAMIDRLDENIGRLLATIDSLGLAERTLVLFLSDNGGIHGHETAGLRGRKGSVYEGGVRSPLLVRLPGRFESGSVVEAIASHVDILPTVCELLQIPPPPGRLLDGKSLVPLLKNSSGRSPHLFVYHSWNRFVPLKDKNWAISGQQFKLVNGELYDLINDPGETTNIASKHPDLVQGMHKEFLTWFEDVTKGQSFRPPAIEVGREDENPVELPAGWATLKGTDTQHVFRGYDWDTIEGWNRLGDSASWKLRVVREGTYEVTASYAAAAESAGSQFRITAGTNRLEGSVMETTPTRDIFIRRTLGTLDLRPGAATLEFRVVQANGGELLALNRLWLKRLEP